MLKNFRVIDLDVAELLVVSGFLKPYELDKAHAWKRNSGQSILEYLTEHGVLEERILIGASEVVNAIKDGRLPKDQERTAMYLVGHSGISIEEAILQCGNRLSTNPWQRQLLLLDKRFSC